MTRALATQKAPSKSAWQPGSGADWEFQQNVVSDDGNVEGPVLKPLTRL